VHLAVQRVDRREARAVGRQVGHGAPTVGAGAADRERQLDDALGARTTLRRQVQFAVLHGGAGDVDRAHAQRTRPAQRDDAFRVGA
jgi:hypothetical protein